MSTLQIVLICLVYVALVTTPLFHIHMHEFAFVNGFLCGIILGDWKTGLILGAAIQTLNMAPVTAGATNSYDLVTATFIAVPLAITGKLSAEVALSLAIPFAVVGGALFTPLERTLNSISTNIGDKCAAKGDIAGMGRALYLYPPLYNFPARFIPMFLILFFGSNYIQNIIDAIPVWLMNGLGVAGGVLPAVGFALFLHIIGKKSLLVYFFLGFYVVYASGMSWVMLAIFGTIVAVLHSWFMGDKATEEV